MEFLRISKCGKQVGRKGAKDEITSMKLFFFLIIFIYLFLVILSLHSAWAFSLVVTHGLRMAVSSLIVEQRL